jgi:RimJ/RimL family protein N-acetyltransferase
MIETERLLLKPYSLDFAEEFYTKFQNDKTYLGDYFSRTLSVTKTLQETKLYFQKKIESCQNNEGFYFGIFFKESDELIGHISVRKSTGQFRKVSWHTLFSMFFRVTNILMKLWRHFVIGLFL